MKTPSEMYRKPVIGKITTKPLDVICNGEPLTFPPAEYEVLEVREYNSKKIYVCNQWYKSGVVQVISEDLVESYVLGVALGK